MYLLARALQNPFALLFLLPAVGAAITAFYMFRLWLLIFHGEPRGYPAVTEAEVVYVGMTTRFVVRLDHGEQLVAVRQNMDAPGHAQSYEGRRVTLAWAPDHIYVLNRARQGETER